MPARRCGCRGCSAVARMSRNGTTWHNPASESAESRTNRHRPTASAPIRYGSSGLLIRWHAAAAGGDDIVTSQVEESQVVAATPSAWRLRTTGRNCPPPPVLSFVLPLRPLTREATGALRIEALLECPAWGSGTPHAFGPRLPTACSAETPARPDLAATDCGARKGCRSLPSAEGDRGQQDCCLNPGFPDCPPVRVRRSGR
jgi:hypothetical protein